MDFRSGSQLIIPENGNVTIQCGGRFIYTHSLVGPMRLGRGSVIGFQKCNVHTYQDNGHAIQAGTADNPLLTLFGNVERSIAQISLSTVFFPKEVRLFRMDRHNSICTFLRPHPDSSHNQPPAHHSQPERHTMPPYPRPHPPG